MQRLLSERYPGQYPEGLLRPLQRRIKRWQATIGFKMYVREDILQRLFERLEQSLETKASQTTGRPGMELWRIFVLAVLKQGLDCDFDRLHELANHHDTLRKMLGHSHWLDKTDYKMRTLVDNVSLLSPKVLAEISQLIVETGHEVVKKSLATDCKGVVIPLSLRPMCITRPMPIYSGMPCAHCSVRSDTAVKNRA